jgi:hypothetical protein
MWEARFFSPAPRAGRESASRRPPAMLRFVDLALEAFEHVEDAGEAGLGSSFRRQRRALAAAAQQQHRGLLAANPRFEFADKARVAREAGAAGPGHMQALRHMADKLSLFAGTHIDQQGLAGTNQLPRHRWRHAARIRKASLERGFTRRVKRRRQGQFSCFRRHLPFPSVRYGVVA